MDRGINSIEAVATEPLAEQKTFVPSGLIEYPWKVEATISEKAATTKSRTSQEKIVNNILHLCPIFSSITSPRDFPLCLIETTIAEKSCTAPKKIPPRIIHKSTGTQPNTAA